MHNSINIAFRTSHAPWPHKALGGLSLLFHHSRLSQKTPSQLKRIAIYDHSESGTDIMDNFVPGFAFILILSADVANKVVGHDNKISFNAFVKHSFHHLDVDPIAWSSVIKVSKCAWACVETVTCFSFNVAAQPDIEGRTLCELLPTDKYNASDKFKANSFYHHHSISVS